MESNTNDTAVKIYKPSRVKEFIFYCVAILFVGSLFYSYHVGTKQSDQLAAINTNQLITLRHADSTRSLVLVLRQETEQFRKDFKALMQGRDDLHKIQKQISISYEKIYEQIARANSDSAQLILYDSLIAKHRRLRLERE